MSAAVLTSASPELASSLSASGLLVVGLCAGWCGTCREFRPAFERLALAQPEATWVWLDVEDDADLAGDIDVDNFPTLAVFQDGQPVYFGVSLPQEGVVGRLLKSLAAGARVIEAEAAVAELPGALARHAADATASRAGR